MHFKYSSMMNVTFVTFMYGLAVPVLFPIALLSYIVLYSVEKIFITYVYKKPPMYDDKLNNAALSILKWAPFFMMAFGYWIMGNKQIFSNVVYPVRLKNDAITTGHHGLDMEVSQALPLFIAAIIFFIFIFFNDLIIKGLEKVNLCDKAKEDEVDEQLGTYFECLTTLSRKGWYIDEMHMREAYGM
jgi:hypothetical protein